MFTVVARDWQGNASAASNPVTVSPPTLPGGSAISNAAGTYTASTLTYSANFLVPFSNHRVFIKSGNAGNCYYAGLGATQLCADYLVQDNGDLLHYGGDSSGTQYIWNELSPTVTPVFMDPTNSNTYTWQIPVAAFDGGNPASQSAIFDADGFYQPTYSNIISVIPN